MLTKTKQVIKKTFVLLGIFTLAFGSSALLPAFKIWATTSPLLEVINLSTATDSQGYSGVPKTVGINETVFFYIEVQNRSSASTAENMTVKAFLPDYLGPDVTTRITASTTLPSVEPGGRTSDTKAILTRLNASDLRLVYKAGSTKVTADMNNDGTKELNNTTMPDSIVGSGLNLGTLIGGTNTVQISFQAQVLRVGVPNLTVNYQGMNVSRNTAWGDSTSADPGDTVKGYIEIHNTNVPSTVNNLNVRVSVPQDRSGAVTSTAFVKGDNHSERSDNTVFNISAGNLKLVSGSVRITWDRDGDGVKELDNTSLTDNIFGPGVSIGDLHGCNNFIIQISFEAVVQPGVVTTTVTQTVPQVVTQVQERVVERVVEKPVEKKVVQIKELPKAGPEVLGLAFTLGMIPVGYLLRKFRP